MTEEMVEVEKQLDAMLDIVIKKTNKLAQIYKSLFDDLVTQGFSKENALQIVTNYNIK